MKRLLSILLVLLFAAQIFSVPALAANESGSPKHIPRVVSVVFDDSGSMYKDVDRWAYTSYAMQAFTAMMGEGDVLYVTYLNNTSASGKITLSSSAKQAEIEKIEDTMFCGGTPNKLEQGKRYLTDEYAQRGANARNAKYYLVVLADGELDRGQGELKSELQTVSADAEKALDGAEFKAYYFSMFEKNVSIPGVECENATTGDEIVNVLRDISADVMGRTKVNHSVSGGKLSFELQYPALSIAVFVQKKNEAFSNVSVPMTKNGSSVSYKTGVYYVDCPTEINKNQNTTVYEEKKPVNPPHGFVALIDNGNGTVEKGSYTIDFSKYGISTNDVVVLVEPAVKIGSKYYIGDSTQPLTFEEAKQYVRDGDIVTVECGLYEMNSDGSLGDPVPSSVLSPEFNLYLNDATVGKKIRDGRYELNVTKDFENKELKIEAVLKGYQPFVLRESFGELNKRPVIDNGNGGNASDVAVIKPEFQAWSDGSKNIRFKLVAADSSMLSGLSIRVDGYSGIPSGVCSSLGNNVRVEGNEIVYAPKFASDTDYSKLPQSIRVTLVDNESNADLAAVNLNVIQPKYRFEINNGLQGVPLSLGMLASNDKKITFSLYACYDGGEGYNPINNYDCDKNITITLNKGVLTGTVNEQTGSVEFTPIYDSAVNTEASPSDIVGADHIIYASASVDGITVESEKITLSVAGGSYKIVVDNQITEPFTLDTVKTNDKKIVFTLLADYNGDGDYGAVEDWDLSAYEKLSITSGDLTGRFETVYDNGGKVCGKSFAPQYDENNNNGIVFTRIAGKVHTVKATLEGSDVTAETTVEVLPPKYDITVRNDGISLVDVELRDNEQYVGFTVSRDGRVLTKEELNALAPFDIGFSKEQKWMALEITVCKDENGEAYISCKPVYDGWTFISSGLWNWLCLFKVEKGDMTVDITVGLDSASAAVDVGTSRLAWIIFIIVIIILAIALWVVFCCLTRVRFMKGYFYVVPFVLAANGLDYKVGAKRGINPNKGGLIRFIFSGKIFIPFSEQSLSITVNRRKAGFVAKKSPFRKFAVRSFPYSKSENGAHFNHGHLEKSRVVAIVNRDTDVDFDPSILIGAACGDNDIKMSNGKYLCEHNSTKIIIFVTKKEEKKIREAARRARRNNRA